VSGIAGIFNLDGQPVDRGLLERMTTAIAHRGPDGTGYWVDGAVGFGHQMLCTTPESLHERQPLRDATGQLCLVMDGRVDNCAELRSALLARGARPRDDTDAELVLCAYQVWGEGCPKEIIGDFAFAIWDARRRQLFCARDFLGIKPFYYHFDGRTFRFASELQQILKDETISREPNEGMVGEYLANAITSKEETLYLSIMRLPPSHSLIIRRGQFSKQLYWEPDFSKNIRYRTDEEYAEHFLAIFQEAVRCRMRSIGPVGIALSGGLDSSSIACVAESLRRENSDELPELVTLSEVFPGEDCDESSYIQDVVEMWGLKNYSVERGNTGIDFFIEQVQRFQDFPGFPNSSSSAPVSSLAEQQGLRVLLDGVGGDEWLSGTSYYYADLISRRKLRMVFQHFRYDVRSLGAKSTILHLLRIGLYPLLPHQVRKTLRRLRHRSSGIPAWINADFAVRLQLADRISSILEQPSSSDLACSDIWVSGTDGFHHLNYEFEERAAAEFRFEQRHPFNDRRLIEFTLAIPEEQRYRQGWLKYILRAAMQEYLPRIIQQRWDKADFSFLFGRSLEKQDVSQLLVKLTIDSIGWTERNSVYEIYQKALSLYHQNNDEYSQYIWNLWMIIGIEIWHSYVYLKSNFLSKASHSADETSNKRILAIS
jgi:asparagine synthase (glutamine-hydrolysing)